jgi:hypothetical protein
MKDRRLTRKYTYSNKKSTVNSEKNRSGKECNFSPTTSILISSPTVYLYDIVKGKSVSTVTGLQWPSGFQEVKFPRFHENGTGWW